MAFARFTRFTICARWKNRQYVIVYTFCDLLIIFFQRNAFQIAKAFENLVLCKQNSYLMYLVMYLLCTRRKHSKHIIDPISSSCKRFNNRMHCKSYTLTFFQSLSFSVNGSAQSPHKTWTNIVWNLVNFKKIDNYIDNNPKYVFNFLILLSSANGLKRHTRFCML